MFYSDEREQFFSLLSNEILEEHTLQNPFTPKLQFLKNVSFRIEKIRKWISKIYSKMEPMHINYKWSVHWKWIEIIFKDKWSKLVEYFQFQLKYCFYKFLQLWRHRLDSQARNSFSVSVYSGINNSNCQDTGWQNAKFCKD